MFTAGRTLPLTTEPQGRLLPWLVAFMMYLAGLSIAGLFLLADVTSTWERGLKNRLTVEIPAPAMPGAADAAVRSALQIVLAAPGVEAAAIVPETEMLALLRPWLGGVVTADELPLPTLIDVTAKPGARIDAGLLGARLEAAVAGARVDDHDAWATHLVRLFRTVEVLALIIVAAITLATVGSVVMATRAGLAIHRDSIEVLHLIGAQDAFIARQFAGQAFRCGLVGGLFGLALVVASLMGLDLLATRLQNGPFPDPSLGPAAWAALGALPIIIAGLTMVTARATVMRSLAPML